MLHFDTIVAPITGVGNAAVGVVRISGAEAWEIAGKVFAPWEPEPMRAVYGRYSFGDDGIALPFEKGRSYTGEEAVELSAHGSAASMRALVEACVAAGARMAEPGEFTQRAFLNGRIDLTQAEGVRDTIEARTEAQLRLANLQREGVLRETIVDLWTRIGGVLGAVEATVDFSEEIGELDVPETAARLRGIVAEIDRLIETAEVRRILRRGLRVAIVGPPNAGKSSLLNALVGSDRAIVTEVPGTTRDFVEEQIEVDGFPVVLIDTAGLRDSQDPVESIGIQRSRAIAMGADVVWFVYDASAGVPHDWEVEIDQAQVVLVANKCDLAPPETGLGISALTREGLGTLLASLPLDRDIANREIAINSRHAELLMRARGALVHGIETLEAYRPADLVSVLLNEAITALGEVTGETASPDMLTRIFSDFCIGK